jgi:CheY-like chemotaxis protein
MLLDLNMPRIDGFGVLQWVRAQPKLKRLAIFIMTASARNEDIERAFDLGATSFLVKPGSLETLTVMAGCMCQWVGITQAPPLT